MWCRKFGSRIFIGWLGKDLKVVRCELSREKIWEESSGVGRRVVDFEVLGEREFFYFGMLWIYGRGDRD